MIVKILMVLALSLIVQPTPLVILITGQSNALSRPLDNQQCKLNNKVITVKFRYASCDDSSPRFVGVTWHRLAAKIAAERNRKVLVINQSKAGMSVTHFLPTGDNYKDTLQLMSNLKVDYIIYYQGERDAKEEMTMKEWRGNFIRIRQAWREDYPGHKLVLVGIQQGCGAKEISTKRIVNAQKSIANTIFVDTFGYEQRDRCHLSDNGMSRLAETIFELIAIIV